MYFLAKIHYNIIQVENWVRKELNGSHLHSFWVRKTVKPGQKFIGRTAFPGGNGSITPVFD